jgi:multiple sugar transport system permease protein
MTAKSVFAKLLVHLLLVVGSLIFIFPLVWMFSTSIKPMSQATELPPQMVPYREMITGSDGQPHRAVWWRPPPSVEDERPEEKLVALISQEGPETVVEEDVAGGKKLPHRVPSSSVRDPGVWRWENYVRAVTYNREILGYIPFLRYARNTLYIAILSVIGVVLSNSLVAYGFSRIKWPGRDLAFTLTLATMMIPSSVLMVPQYVMFKSFGWVGSPKPLWVPAFFGGAFNIFLLRQFFLSLPHELSEAARIDGCSEFSTFKDVILPLAKPALAVVALFHFMFVWNDFQGPLIYLTDQKTYTLAYGLQAYQSQHGGTQWPMLMAAATIVVMPVIVLFFLAQKTFIQGITVTGMKN